MTGSIPLSLGTRTAIVALSFALLALGACQHQERAHIQWRLPLSAPPDPHGAGSSQTLPEWAAARTGRASLVLLQKSTARLFPLDLAMGGEVDVRDVHVKLQGLARGLRLKEGSYIEDENVHNPAAFVQVELHGKPVYSGWIYQEFPELFGPDLADWKLTLRKVEIPPAAKEEEQGKSPGARSSAG